MNSIRAIIDHNRRQLAAIDDEIARLLIREPTGSITVADHDKWISGWKKDRRIARDTISYLETLDRLQAETTGTR